MYEQFFNLKAEPFRLSPDHRFCYNHALYAKAKAYMAYAFMRAEGFVMVTGRPGTGKTTLVGDLVESLAREDVTVGKLVSTQLEQDDLLRAVAFAFDLDATADKSVVLQQLLTRFRALYRENQRALLIVDEAQDLAPKALEELRLLTNLQEDGHPLLQIFLLGQSELLDLIHSPGLEQVHQRIVAASHLEALKPDETRAYVEHRLRTVGWNNDPQISLAVYPVIYKFSEGVPRRINLICSRLFLHCAVEQRHHISLEDARTVVQELQDEQLSTRNLLHDDVFFAEDVWEEPDTSEAESVAATSVSEGESGAGSVPSPEDIQNNEQSASPPSESPSAVADDDAPAAEEPARLKLVSGAENQEPWLLLPDEEDDAPRAQPGAKSTSAASENIVPLTVPRSEAAKPEPVSPKRRRKGGSSKRKPGAAKARPVAAGGAAARQQEDASPIATEEPSPVGATRAPGMGALFGVLLAGVVVLAFVIFVTLAQDIP